MLVRFAAVAFLALGLAEPALAQSAPVRLAGVPTPQTTKLMKPLAASRGFNAANAARVAIPQAGTVTVARPSPTVAAIIARPKSGPVAAMWAIRDRGAYSASIMLASLRVEDRSLIDKVFGASASGLERDLWDFFFRGATVIADGGGTRRVYFANPVYDAILVTDWTGGASPTLVTAYVVSGDRLRGEPVAPALKWTTIGLAKIPETAAAMRLPTRKTLRPVPTAAAAAGDRDIVLGRILALRHGLKPIMDSQPARQRLSRIVSAVSRGDAAALAAEGIEAGTARRTKDLPRDLRGNFETLGGFATGDADIVIVVPRSHPGLVYLVAVPDQAAMPAALVPIALAGPAERRS